MIKGWLYAAGGSARDEAELFAEAQSYIVRSRSAEPIAGSVSELVVSQRVGNIPRKITLADNAIFETNDNDAVDALLLTSGHRSRRAGILHTLETRWQWIGLALVATVLVGFSTVYWGMPWASKKIAYSLPVAVTKVISAETLELLDKGFLDKSELEEETQQAIRTRFEAKLLVLQDEAFPYRLHFRNMGDIPNAFALPSGDIIITDRLVELADNQDEIDAVLLHEIGHVVYRHGLQRVLHSSFLTVAIIMISGDVTAVNNLAIALPVLLLESHYSRENETEADVYAFETMIKAGIDPISFSTIMEKISAPHPVKSEAGQKPERHSSEDEKDNQAYEYLSSHPPSRERIRMAEQYSEKFKNR